MQVIDTKNASHRPKKKKNTKSPTELEKDCNVTLLSDYTHLKKIINFVHYDQYWSMENPGLRKNRNLLRESPDGNKS